MQDLGVDGMIILKLILKIQFGEFTDWFVSQQRQAGASCELGNETSGFINFGEFLD